MANGLVDELGSVARGLEVARELAGLPDDAPLVDVPIPRRAADSVPAPPAAAVSLVAYALAGVRAWNSAGALCVCPVLPPELR